MPATPTAQKPCEGGCTFWTCARPDGHPGPCYPANAEADAQYERHMAKMAATR